MTLYEVLISELKLSQRIVSDGDVVVPRFRIMGPEGHFVILMELPDDAKERDRRMRLIAGFMTWKMAQGFVLSVETKSPDAITSFAVTRSGCGGFMRRITRGRTLSFAPAEGLGPQDVGDDLPALLPKRESTITGEQVRELERAFGTHGEMPAKRVS
jgi:hypothetical protein